MSKLSLSEMRGVSMSKMPNAVDAAFAQSQVVVDAEATSVHARDSKSVDPGVVTVSTFKHQSMTWPLFIAFAFGCLVGANIASFYYSSRSIDGESSDVRPIDDKKRQDDRKQSSLPSGNMIFVTELRDGSPEESVFAMKLKDYCKSHGIEYRKLDKEMGSAATYIEKAAAKGVSPPFVAFSDNGNTTAIQPMSYVDNLMSK